MNSGKKIGLLFVGIAAILQIGVVGFKLRPSNAPNWSVLCLTLNVEGTWLERTRLAVDNNKDKTQEYQTFYMLGELSWLATRKKQ
ncbi:hypothetical protein SADUNF_Sadunf03G0039800 [Salix dunnii]|uniref:Uncharacterized protein n=1 Tax=Salix dunnii TaxID=1413687 RepID=A0A835N385_9ROSI|nr:hypothetical protein SADUNF_Sadunf03G0039800 [Salix dunnii]